MLNQCGKEKVHQPLNSMDRMTLTAIKIYNKVLFIAFIFYLSGKCNVNVILQSHCANFLLHFAKKKSKGLDYNEIRTFFFVWIKDVYTLFPSNPNLLLCIRAQFLTINQVLGLQSVAVSVGPQSVSDWSVSGVKQQMDTLRISRGLFSPASLHENRRKTHAVTTVQHFTL